MSNKYYLLTYYRCLSEYYYCRILRPLRISARHCVCESARAARVVDVYAFTYTQLKFIKTCSSKAEHTNNNLYRYSKIYVNMKYSTIKYSRITNTKKYIK